MKNSDKCPRSASFNSIFGISDKKRSKKRKGKKKYARQRNQTLEVVWVLTYCGCLFSSLDSLEVTSAAATPAFRALCFNFFPFLFSPSFFAFFSISFAAFKFLNPPLLPLLMHAFGLFLVERLFLRSVEVNGEWEGVALIPFPILHANSLAYVGRDPEHLEYPSEFKGLTLIGFPYIILLVQT